MGISGRCGNIDYCSLADSRQTVAADPGTAGVCPECARPLLPPAGKPPGILRPALAGIGVICLTGAAIYMGMSNFHPAHANALAQIDLPDTPVAQHAGLAGTPFVPRPPTPARPIVPAALVQAGLGAQALPTSPGR